MTDTRTVDVHIDPYEYMNEIGANLWLSSAIPFALPYFTKIEVRRIGILFRHTHSHYAIILIISFVLLSY